MNNKVYEFRDYGYQLLRSDGASVFRKSRTVYYDSFNKLSACMLDKCPFCGLTCNKCCYSL